MVPFFLSSMYSKLCEVSFSGLTKGFLTHCTTLLTTNASEPQFKSRQLDQPHILIRISMISWTDTNDNKDTARSADLVLFGHSSVQMGPFFYFCVLPDFGGPHISSWNIAIAPFCVEKRVPRKKSWKKQKRTCVWECASACERVCECVWESVRVRVDERERRRVKASVREWQSPFLSQPWITKALKECS